MDEIQSWDERRDYFIAGDAKETIAFAAEHWIHSAKRAIMQRGRFAVALSGGSTPKAIYEALAKSSHTLDWSKVWLFWSDERSVPPDHTDSNYHMAMSSGLAKLPIPPTQIFRMQAESNLEAQAKDYEEKIHHYLGKHLFDLIMLGIGEDGHTASLFPKTTALEMEDRLVAANYIPEKKSWRLTLTFPCIHQSAHSAIYAIGPSKQTIVPQVLQAAIVSPFPASRIGTPDHKALWVLDNDASKFLT
ncbi:MAG TPA: 6-phosphogluconolactonase [Chlamydiales bacterium]|nr:6-phosphogluconolactonase [Chlamydiales bacterium]